MKIDIHIVSHLAQLFLEREIFQTKFVEKIIKHILRSIYTYIYFFFEICALCEIMWKNIVEPERPGMTIWCMRIAR
jgi:hypothetical protein